MNKEEILKKLSKEETCFYENDQRISIDQWKKNLPVTEAQIQDASARLERFAPLLKIYFPETEERNGIIESDLVPIVHMKKILEKDTGRRLPEKLFLKKDSHLAVAGSVKARGGIYEILKHAEDLLIQEKNWTLDQDYRQLADDTYREFFSQYIIQVGSTGNLGLSIGIISAKLGFQVVVHMSADAKAWKKALLRSKGVTVIEYPSDYSKAVEEGRKLSDQNPKSYFVDDEKSIDLFLGYAVAAFRLKEQCEAQKIQIDGEHPLVIYIPCGVGGAPGGITYGCKYVFGENVYCYFVEPTQACCMILGMVTGKHDGICVQDIGLSGLTQADGLAVGRSSHFVSHCMEAILDGLFTVQDADLMKYMKFLYDSEDIFIEPSACAGFEGYLRLSEQGFEKMDQGTHIVWATGGSLVPDEERNQYLKG